MSVSFSQWQRSRQHADSVRVCGHSLRVGSHLVLSRHPFHPMNWISSHNIYGKITATGINVTIISIKWLTHQVS